VLLVPLSNNVVFQPIVKILVSKLRTLGISSRIDDSGASIGKRYSRNDELGTPLGITVDFQSIKDQTYTLRDRDSTKQVRADLDTILGAVQAVVNGTKVWADIEKELPAFESQITDAKEVSIKSVELPAR
jgi:glycyl-tRNA synthetase